MTIIPDYTKQQTPALKPLLFFNIRCKDPKDVYTNDSLSQKHVAIVGGFVVSLDDSYKFDAKILHGGDDITFYTSDPSTGHLDCSMYLQFNDDANQIGLVTYSGLVKFEGKTADVVSSTASEMTFEEGYVTSHPIFKLNGDLKDESWVLNHNMIGKGRFVRDKDNVLHVQYYIYGFA
ncbi:hypothetical protein DAMA08_021270 [Martiniozyma asiatica (nom. inval.)]|nr:hypothetical protein DAMA08_021270 [Martiniozyma asiatica]